MTHASDFSRLWNLDPAVTFLNHGSFGACPRPVLEEQRRWQDLIERQPVRFLHREVETHLDVARARLAEFMGARPDQLVFVRNATAGVNTVLRSLEFKAYDELLTTDHEYRACRNALDYVAERWRAKVVVASVPFPLKSEDAVLAALQERVTPRTRLLLVDHVTSPTGLVLPMQHIVEHMNRRGVDTLVDGAHVPGMLGVQLDELGAAYFTGNCHKWMCTPKGSALLYVRADRQERIRPLGISHGATAWRQRSDRSRFLTEFDWQGTEDPSAWLSIPCAIDFLGRLLLGGWRELRERNRALALRARKHVCEALGVEIPAPDSMIGSLATIPLPPTPTGSVAQPPLFQDPLQHALFDKHGIEIPVFAWPAPPRRWVRLSAQVYNEFPEYQKLAEALLVELGHETAAASSCC